MWILNFFYILLECLISHCPLVEQFVLSILENLDWIEINPHAEIVQFYRRYKFYMPKECPLIW